MTYLRRTLTNTRIGHAVKFEYRPAGNRKVACHYISYILISNTLGVRLRTDIWASFEQGVKAGTWLNLSHVTVLNGRISDSVRKERKSVQYSGASKWA